MKLIFTLKTATGFRKMSDLTPGSASPQLEPSVFHTGYSEQSFGAQSNTRVLLLRFCPLPSIQMYVAIDLPFWDKAAYLATTDLSPTFGLQGFNITTSVLFVACY